MMCARNRAVKNEKIRKKKEKERVYIYIRVYISTTLQHYHLKKIV